MTDTREVLHDDSPGDVHAWQPVATLAAALAIAERTVRARVAAGTVERLTGPGGRSYYRVPPAERASVATDGSHGSGIAGSRQLATEEAFALVVREHQAHVERLALELGQARAAVGHLEHVRQVEATAQAATVAHLEHELGTVRQLARAIGEQAQREQARAVATEEQLAQARAQVEHERQRAAAFVAQVEAERAAEQARAARLERLAQAPWYAVRERKRLRRELSA